MLPQWENSRLVLHAAHGTGNWIGAAVPSFTMATFILPIVTGTQSIRDGATGPL